MLLNVIILISALILKLQCFKEDAVLAADRLQEGFWTERSCCPARSAVELPSTEHPSPAWCRRCGPARPPPGCSDKPAPYTGQTVAKRPHSCRYPQQRVKHWGFRLKIHLQLLQRQERCTGLAHIPPLSGEKHKELGLGVVLLLGSVLVLVKLPASRHGHQGVLDLASSLHPAKHFSICLSSSSSMIKNTTCTFLLLFRQENNPVFWISGEENPRAALSPKEEDDLKNSPFSCLVHLSPHMHLLDQDCNLK